MVSLQPGKGQDISPGPGGARALLLWDRGGFKHAQARRSLHCFGEGSSPTQEVGASGKALPAFPQALPGMQIKNTRCCGFSGA